MAVNTTKVAAEDNSERKRISIPKADDSVLAWWATQNDPSLSVRLLIRNEIERSGYTDMAFRPVVQQPLRGRPSGPAGEATEGDQPTEGIQFEDGRTSSAASHVSTSPVREPLHAVETAMPRDVQPRVMQPRVPQLVASGGGDLIDNIMNG